ncbi:MAG: serine/threonine-protein kinase, partial [Solirubrobacterales bacterium]
GDVFAGLLLEAEIGRGGMGVVFRARDVALNRPRAVKVIAGEYSSDPVFAARFRREARIASSVEHPNVVPVLSAGEEGGRLYLVMRLVDGTDLASLLDHGPLSTPRAAGVLEDIAAGLDAAHAAGLVHRDVKPANVLVESTAEGERAYLTDFGISKIVDVDGEGKTAATGLTRGGQILGTADYVAPEQIEEGTADARSDVYSLACVAFECLTGVPPFRRDSELSTLVAQTKAPRPVASVLNSTLPASVDAPIASGMAIDPAERPASGAALIGEIERGLSGAPRGTERSRSIWPWGTGLALFAALAVAWVLVMGDDGVDRPKPPAIRGGEAPTVTTGEVGAGPVGIAVGYLRVWVASRDADEVDRLRLGEPKQADPPVPLGAPRAIAVGFGSIWVVNDQALYRLDPGEQGAVPVRIDAGDGPGDVAVDDRYVWVADDSGDRVIRVDPTTNSATGSVPAGEEPRSIATGGGAVWVVSSGDAKLTKIDPESASVLGSPTTVGVRPTSVAFGEGRVWVADNAASELYSLDPGSAGAGPGAVRKPVETAASPRGVAVGLGAVWVASGAEDLVQRFDPATLESIGDPIDVGGNPADIAVGAGAAYTADFDDGTVSRIEP